MSRSDPPNAKWESGITHWPHSKPEALFSPAAGTERAYPETMDTPIPVAKLPERPSSGQKPSGVDENANSAALESHCSFTPVYTACRAESLRWNHASKLAAPVVGKSACVTSFNNPKQLNTSPRWHNSSAAQASGVQAANASYFAATVRPNDQRLDVLSLSREPVNPVPGKHQLTFAVCRAHLWWWTSCWRQAHRLG